MARRWMRFFVTLGAIVCSGCIQLSTVSPNPSQAGASITLAGSGFGATQGANSAVLYDGASIPVVWWSDTQIVATVPADKPAGTYTVAVEVNGALSLSLFHTVSWFTISAPVFTPSATSILAGTLAFTSSVPTTSTVVVTGAGGSFVVPASGILSPEPATNHQIMILGLTFQQTYSFTVGGRDGQGHTASGPSLGYTPGAAPGGLVPMNVTVATPAQMQPGFTFFPATRVGIPSTSVIYAIDAQGHIVWYDAPTQPPPPAAAVPVSRVRRLSNGNLLYIGAALAEIDMLGRDVRSFTNTDLGIGPIHHDAIELPSGNLLALAAEMRVVSGYPADAGTGCTTCQVVGDEIVELNPDTRAIVWRVSLFDLLDPHRTLLDIHPTPGASFNDATWNWWFGSDNGGTRDWTHSNALIYDASDDSIIVSCRHQDVIAKISRATKQLVWVIGSDWSGSSGDDAWPFLQPSSSGILLPYHQHGPFLLPNGNLLVYDNGNDRTPWVTRELEFRIDAPHMALGQPWEWIDPDYNPPLVSFFAGNMEGEPNGNVLITDGALPLENGPDWIRLSEVTRPTTPGTASTKVWEVKIQDPNAQVLGLNSFRVTSLYPP